MIGFETTLGVVEISQEYFANLIGQAASECYGVAGMINSPYQDLRSRVLRRDAPDKGVRVRNENGKLTVDIHIAVTYGVNIAAMQLYRDRRGGLAVMVLESDQSIPAEAVEALRSAPGIVRVTYLDLEGGA